MVSVIALVGRPNVGKSTLFNRMTRSRDALVADLPGLTRDRQYGEGQLDGHGFIVIDTGGIGVDDVKVDELMSKQSLQAVDEADVIYFVVDARAGVTPVDSQIANLLRQQRKPVHLVVNKTDGLDIDIACGDFYELGFSKMYATAASHGRGVQQLLHKTLDKVTVLEPEDEKLDSETGTRLAIIGRPNVGKSTLVNRLLGEERVVAYDLPGTTRDSIAIPFDVQGKKYTLIDTAGIRKRGRITETVEKFSVVKALKAIERSHVCLVLFDAREGVTEQDMHVIRFAIDAGKALVLAVNKWDGMNSDDKDSVKETIRRRLAFADFADMHYISALHGTGVGHLLRSVDEAYAASTKKFTTSQLTRILEDAVNVHTPPLVHGRRIKLRYAHAGGHNPPIFVIHGNQTDSLPEAYKKYLVNTFRKVLNIKGTPIRLQFKSGDNPFKDKTKERNLRQNKKHSRLFKYHKKK